MRLKDAKKFMSLAIKQAELGRGKTGHNPLVGCIIVKAGRVISSGFHHRFGGPHAEVMALTAAGKKARGAVIFVTLEPCSYHGKTPPCTEAIIRSGIKELFCAGLDPNPLNNGKGIAALKAGGIMVTCGILRSQAERLNPDFIMRMKNRKPFVALKLAQSIDGRIATRGNDSKWISSTRSRVFVQGLRQGYDAVLVGINTVLCDNPLLSIRNSAQGPLKTARQPVKIIIDTHLKIPVNARIFGISSPGGTIIATTRGASPDRESVLRKKGADIIRAGSGLGRVNLNILMKKITEKGINSILVEGGGEIAASMLQSGLVDKVYFFICPVIIGGRDAVYSIGGKGAATMKDAVKLSNIKLQRINGDMLVEADVYRDS
jgi:diaminohydroxyphosphoribosylaminopyrimidine deaminase / 5-amino-6-(5-phosphoribosylamino)uracil reductase